MQFRKLAVYVTAIGLGIAVGRQVGRRHKKEKEALMAQNTKFSDNYQLLNHWLEIRNEGKSLACYFNAMGYKRIAVYGMAELANRLMEDLEGSGLEIVYGIDRDASCSISRIAEVYSPQEDILPEADVVVVTPYYALEAIKKNLSGKVACPVVSIEEVVWSV
ncbi:hypothetical protein [uncultured Acetatifactor sp.]|jgi:hypothetical protein|uniref:hypothetical protein n=1 Tax=uncultured Acetatifactor sp. TaxID=1671927 RepID=UPI00260D3152|nr:hypothetical protein [uncultured Acetatifactor sp.]